MRLLLPACLLGTAFHPLLAQSWSAQKVGTTAEFRGMHAVDAKVVWAAGKGGTVVHTADAGKTWKVDTIPGAASLFLVAVQAIDGRRAWVLGTAFEGGSLARIYHTEDAGATWKVQYENALKGIFFDGMAMWDAKHGIAFSDPIDGKIRLITTGDGANWYAWLADKLPAMLPGEAAFAASGTALTVKQGGHEVWIGTGGGAHARVLYSPDRGNNWKVFDTPASGGGAKGIFGIAIGERHHVVAVGGDYRKPELSTENLLLSDDEGRTWRLASSAGLVGVQYGVTYAGGDIFLSTGPGGSALSTDAGRTWKKLDGPGYNTVGCAKGVCWAAGVDGKVGRLALK